jgi:cyclic pyranopterin phosphate synthase
MKKNAAKAPKKRAKAPAARLSHLDARGNARMVDIGAKPESRREAVAEAVVVMDEATWALVAAGEIPKGDVLSAARVAGVMAAKRTPDLIPLCHPLLLSQVDVTFEAAPAEPGKTALRILTVARCLGQTGVEMEAMTAASVASLTVYDMCKAVDRWMSVREVRLLEKRGGTSGTVRRPGC